MPPRWSLTVFGLALTVAFWPGISGAATSPRWAIAAIGASLLLFCARPIRITIAHLAGALFAVWCFTTLAWSASPDGTDAAFKFGILAVCFCLGSAIDDLEPLWIGAGIGIALSSALTIIQLAGFAPVAYLTIPSGLFLNGNYMAEAAVLVLIGLAAYGRWWLAVACLPAATFGLARGAILAGVTALTAWLWMRSRSAAVAVVLVGVLAGSAMWASGYRTAHITERIGFWRDAVAGITVTGQGLGSFRDGFVSYAEQSDLRRSRPGQPHNEALGIAFETGIVGLGLFALFVAMLLGPMRPESLVLIALATESLFAQPLHLPATAVLGCLAAGACTRSAHHVRDTALLGGILLRAGLGRRGRGYGSIC